MSSPITNQSPTLISGTHVALGRLVEKFDILLGLAAHMIDDGYHGSLISLSAINREHHQVLAPFLKRTRKRILAKLSELDELDEERYRDIQILKAEASSKLPIFPWATGDHFEGLGYTGDSIGTTLYKKGFRPRLLIITGRPPTTLAAFRKECLPSVQVVRIKDDDKVELRSFGHWDDPEEDEEPREELDDCIRALLDGEDDDEDKHYPDGTYPLCDVRYDHKAIREPRVFTELRLTTWEGSNMAYTRTTGADVLSVGFEEAVGHVLPSRDTSILYGLLCSSITCDISFKVSADSDYCHMDAQDIREIANMFLGRAREQADRCVQGYRLVQGKVPDWTVRYRLFAVREHEGWPDVAHAQPLVSFAAGATRQTEEVLAESFTACTVEHKCLWCRGGAE